MSTATATRWFLEHSIGVFPIISGGKTPACKSWTDYRATEKEAATWKNYGVILGVLAVVDTDTPEDEAWAQQYLLDTPFMVHTTRGLHRYYRQLAPSPKYIHRDGLTIEHRNVGQYVVGPGSTHPSGLIYRAADWSWKWSDIPYFPEFFCYDDRPPGERGSEDGMPYRLPPRICAGERHDKMFALLRSLLARGVPFDPALEACYAVDQTHCFPPLGKDTLKPYLKRVGKHQHRGDFAPSPQVGWDLASGLLDAGIPVGQAIVIVRSVTPDFDPGRSDD